MVKEKKIDQRTRLSKMLIRQAFLELLKTKPIRKISVREICENAEINRGTFYVYYSDVYDLLNKIEEEMIISFETALQTLLENETVSIKDICFRMFEVVKENADLCSTVFGGFGDRNFAKKLVDIGRVKYLKKYAKQFPNATRKKLDAYYTFVSMGCVGLIEEWFNNEMSEPISSISESAEQIMMYGAAYLMN